MKKRAVAGLLLVGLVASGLLLARAKARGQEAGTSTAAPACWPFYVSLTAPGCGGAPRILGSPFVPSDVPGGIGGTNFNAVQRNVDAYSWQLLLAYSWPASATYRGVPNYGACLGGPGPLVWETWKETDEVFLSGGADPGPWNTPQVLPPGTCATGGGKVLYKQAKADDFVYDPTQPTVTDGTLPPTLTDQAGKLVRYEIRMNETLYNYIRATGMYDSARQLGKDPEVPVGSAIVKAAWREVPAAQEPYFVSEPACVCDRVREGGTYKFVNCRQTTIGLVGFHVMVRTPTAPQWIWATFEQRDNVTNRDGFVSFNNPNCAPNCPPVNQQMPLPTPNQIARVLAIPAATPNCQDPKAGVDDVAQMNKDVQAAVAALGSRLRYYELVNAQWPLGATGGWPPGAPLKPAPEGSAPPPPPLTPVPDTVVNVAPTFLGNTTIESYVQASSSCMGCHAMARTADPNAFHSGDFTFLFQMARPTRTPSPCQVIPPPPPSAPSWYTGNWAAVRDGYLYATQTYENPATKPYVGSKLHCQSCHLNAGGNAASAWWVKLCYAYPTTCSLQDRVLKCFTNSENGKPFCDPQKPSGPGSCNDNAVMRDFLAYFNWLDQYWDRNCAGGTPPAQPTHGYPPLACATPSVKNGKSVFQQKCAFCHGLNGEGRYGASGNSYYRPALWGGNSFNQAAGLANVPLLAAFVHGNMPYGSGGVLTAQEAWDVAAYVDSNGRPPKPSVTPKPCLGPKGTPCQVVTPPPTCPPAAVGAP